ncbi:trans-acting enoyl reductase [Acrasis kona]|uniref:Trans-acting enoyl reductase n=1 Tax=Acrasis kona TaxID=1008807 RepID=A0AAW2ZM81_9EUKA
MSYQTALETVVKKVRESKDKKQFLLYGATGYTGELITALIEENNLQDLCILSGRDPKKVEALAKKHKVTKTKPFSLDVPNTEVDAILKKLEVSAVLNCAGPFQRTAHVLIDSCVRTGISYLDITGEIEVFEYSLADQLLNKQAKEKNIVVTSGVGFDVVPSDCLAASVAEAYKKKYSETAHHLELAISFGDSAALSHGTAKTMVLGLGKPEPTRRDGKIIPGRKLNIVKKVKFPSRSEPTNAVSVPWGDVSTAYHSTSIPNIDVLFEQKRAPPALLVWIINLYLVQLILRFLFSIPLFVKGTEKLVELMPRGPEQDKRKSNEGTSLVGVASSKDSTKKVRGTAFTTEGYTFTADSALLSTLKVLAGDVKEYGCVTPSIVFGSDFVNTMPKSGVKVE